MSSKLFHTVVAFGISLGAASTGCAAAPSEETASAEAQVVATPEPEKDRFCEVAWPTTKGGPRPQQAQACIDPDRACGDYPGSLFNWEQCVPVVESDATCNFEKATYWQFCKAGDYGPEWTCPAGTKPQSQCSAPAEATR